MIISMRESDHTVLRKSYLLYVTLYNLHRDWKGIQFFIFNLKESKFFDYFNSTGTKSHIFEPKKILIQRNDTQSVLDAFQKYRFGEDYRKLLFLAEELYIYLYIYIYIYIYICIIHIYIHIYIYIISKINEVIRSVLIFLQKNFISTIKHKTAYSEQK